MAGEKGPVKSMATTVVVGGQYGSEGKGKVTALLAREQDRPWIVRCGGPNSGHTVTIDGRDTILRQVPSCLEPEQATFCIGAGCVVDEAVLIGELNLLRIHRDQIIVDPRAVLVTERDKRAEDASLGHIASTFSGTGEALQRRMSRGSDIRFSCNSRAISHRCRVELVAPLLHTHLKRGGNIIVEGTQGFGLSLLHGPDYPYLTSRDTTAAAFAMEVGLAPSLIDRVVLVVRTFPIRVGGKSGPLPNEISWEKVQELSGAPEPYYEYTSVTKRLRRVAMFDQRLVKMACDYNRPTSLAVMGLDRINYSNTGLRHLEHLSKDARVLVHNLEDHVGVPVQYVGTGFGTLDAISLSVRVSVLEA